MTSAQLGPPRPGNHVGGRPGHRHTGHRHTGGALATIGALGVVFGDIGTSPLYCLTAALAGAERVSSALVYGITSMVVWTVTAIVTVLYVRILLRFNNHGEGGILALLARTRRAHAAHPGPRRTLAGATAVAMVGTGMFLGDGVITPGISVLAAVEGVTVRYPDLAGAVVPATVAILVALFALQRVGTARVGAVFGPAMLAWFLTCAALGGASLARTPSALTALSPHWILLLIAERPWTAFLALGSVVLAVTGAEALFADMGHFGRATVTRAWFLVVYPALLVCYLGQAAAVVRDPAGASNPFYAMVPDALTLPLVALATVATVIASQAVISGAYSVVQQAGRLGLLPRLRVVHTSTRTPGQIYLPTVNAALAVLVLAVVIAFRRSEALASAYGVAVTLTILMTTALLLALLATRTPHPRVLHPRTLRAGVLALMVLASVYVAGNLIKIATGGWLPLALGGGLCAIMWAWYDGERRLGAAKRAFHPPLADVLAQVRRAPRVAGVTVFFTHSIEHAPGALVAALEQYGVLPRTVLILHVHTGTVPRGYRVQAWDLAPGLTAVELEFGYREPPLVAETLTRHGPLGQVEGPALAHARFALTVHVPVLGPQTSMPRPLARLYLALKRLSLTRADAFHLPIEATNLHGRELPI